MKEKHLESALNDNNILISGRIHSGKTNHIIKPVVEDIVKKQESFLVIDSKEEYVQNYLNELKEIGYKTIVLNLRDFNKSDSWNCLEYPYNLYKKGNIDQAAKYLEMLAEEVYLDKEIEDNFWTNSAGNLFVGCSLILFKIASEEMVNINSVFNMIDSGSIRFSASNYLTEYFKEFDSNSIEHNYLSSILLAPKDTLGGILSVAKQKLGILTTRNTSIFNSSTFNYDEVLEKPTAIFVITKDESKSLNFVASMFINQLYNYLIEKNIEKRFNFVLDNFDTLINLVGFTNMLSSCTSRNIKFLISTRDINKIYSEYGDYIKRIVDVIEINDEDRIEISMEENINSNEEVDYPRAVSEEIKIFDFQTYVKNYKMTLMENDLELTSKVGLDEKKEIDSLLKEIDKKIVSLDLKDVKNKATEYFKNIDNFVNIGDVYEARHYYIATNVDNNGNITNVVLITKGDFVTASCNLKDLNLKSLIKINN